MIVKRKKDQIEAFKWTGGPDQTEDPEWIVSAIRHEEAAIHQVTGFSQGCCMVFQYSHRIAYPGDWIIFNDGPIHSLSDKDFHDIYIIDENVAVRHNEMKVEESVVDKTARRLKYE